MAPEENREQREWAAAEQKRYAEIPIDQCSIASSHGARFQRLVG